MLSSLIQNLCLGKVITAPPNVNTNPEAKDLFKFRKHLPDQYDRARELRNVFQIISRYIFFDCGFL